MTPLVTLLLCLPAVLALLACVCGLAGLGPRAGEPLQIGVWGSGRTRHPAGRLGTTPDARKKGHAHGAVGRTVPPATDGGPPPECN